jgi:hypothetical protein
MGEKKYFYVFTTAFLMFSASVVGVTAVKKISHQFAAVKTAFAAVKTEVAAVKTEVARFSVAPLDKSFPLESTNVMPTRV